MTDDERHLSRRERRMQQERDSARIPADTDALALGPISESIPTHAADGRLLSRRERRRLERAREPLETWTAEEEMIATGQVPAMTPDRIAEQERLAHQRANEAQQEAEAASTEIEGLVNRPATAQSADGAVGRQPASTQSAASTSAPSATSASATTPPAFPPSAESAPQRGHEAEREPASETPWSEPQEQPIRTDAPRPERPSLLAAMAGDDSPSAPSPDEGTPASAPSASSAAAPAGPESSGLGRPPGMTPEMFEELFPPGSLQRRMIEEQASSEVAEVAEPEDDPAAEIRRLTQEAVAGIGAASQRGDQEGESLPEETSEPTGDHALSTGSEQSAPSFPSAEAAESEPPTFDVPAFGPVSEPNEGEPHPADSSPQWPVSSDHQAPGTHEQTPFDEIIGDASEAATPSESSGIAAEFERLNTDDGEGSSMPGAQQAPPTTPAFSAVTELAAPWGEHPLSQVDREAPQLPEMAPAQSVPQPDLSGIGAQGTAANQADQPYVGPVPTGQIEVAPRERPELDSNDVPRHFKWAHLSVFGAVALLLGVVVWHVV